MVARSRLNDARHCQTFTGKKSMPQRATKIVATLGPASSTPHLLEQMIRAGVNVVRLNVDARHGAGPHIDRAETRCGQRAQACWAWKWPSWPTCKGPKIRVGKFAEGKVMAGGGRDRLCSTPRAPNPVTSTAWCTGLQGPAARRRDAGRPCCLLNDGLIVLRVERVEGEAVHTTVADRRRAVQQQGHQQARRWPDRPSPDRQGHGRHQDRDGPVGRLRGGELSQDRDRHGTGAPTVPWWRAPSGPQTGPDRQDRAR